MKKRLKAIWKLLTQKEFILISGYDFAWQHSGAYWQGVYESDMMFTVYDFKKAMELLNIDAKKES